MFLNPSLRLSDLVAQLGPSAVASNMKSLGRVGSHATDLSFFSLPNITLLCVRILPSNSSLHGHVLTLAGDTIGSVTLSIGVVHFGSWLAGDISSVPEQAHVVWARMWRALNFQILTNHDPGLAAVT